jgi:hypothetical protein
MRIALLIRIAVGLAHQYQVETGASRGWRTKAKKGAGDVDNRVRQMGLDACERRLLGLFTVFRDLRRRLAFCLTLSSSSSSEYSSAYWAGASRRIVAIFEPMNIA